MINSSSPFHKISVEFENQPILYFEKNTTLAKKYIKEIQGEDIKDLFIGWICERDSFFAYLYKFMKREARDNKSTKFAAEIARAGFQILLPKINSWVSNSTLPVLIVPVPSHYGVSERFATELCRMLNENSRKVSKVKEIFNKSNKLIEVKKINSWEKRSKVVDNIFSLKKRERLNKYSVLLVDDIVTSGSSLRKCANILKQCGANNVTAVSLATNMFDRFSYKAK